MLHHSISHLKKNIIKNKNNILKNPHLQIFDFRVIHKFVGFTKKILEKNEKILKDNFWIHFFREIKYKYLILGFRTTS